MSIAADVLAKGERINAAVSSICSELATAGIPIDAGTPLEKYPSKVRDLANQALPAGDEAILSITVNKAGAAYELPADAAVLADLLRDARIVVSVEGVGFPIVVPVDRLTDATYAARIPISMIRSAVVRLMLGTASPRYTSAPIALTARPGSVTYGAVTTYLDTTETVEIGRVQRYADASGSSFLVKRVHSGAGTKQYFGGWLPNGEWLDQSGLKVSVYDCAGPDASPVERIISTSGGDAVDVTSLLACIKNARQVKVTYNLDVPIDNFFMRYDRLYVKKERTQLEFPTFADNGTVAKTETTDCIIIWYASTQIDESYHLHPLFVRYERDAVTGVTSETELPYGYIARYPIKFVDAKLDGKAVRVATSAPDKSREVGAERRWFLAACRALNDVPVTIDGVDYLPNDSRRFSMVAHYAEVSFLQYICYLLFGVDVQAAIKGICTSSVSSTSNGNTDWLFAKGVLFGARDTQLNTESCLIAGIEDGLHSSTGWMTADLTFFTERFADNSTEYFMLHARDRLDFQLDSAEVATLTANGYRKLAFQVGSNGRQGVDPTSGARDLFIGKRSSEPDCDNITAAGVDAFWTGGVPAENTVGRNAFLVAAGGYRGSGTSLGVFCLDAGYGLSAAYGNYWRSRTSLQLVPIER